jgi:hypothetical protein
VFFDKKVCFLHFSIKRFAYMKKKQYLCSGKQKIVVTMYKLSYSQARSVVVPDTWCYGMPMTYKQETKVFDGYSETFNTYDECVKRKKELEKISNKQYINFEIVELKN